MSPTPPDPRFRTLVFEDTALDVTIDASRVRFAPGFLDAMEPRLQRAFAAMAALEAGAIANPDEPPGGALLAARPRARARAGAREAIEDTLERHHRFAATCTRRACGPSGRALRAVCW
jgi:glucose-6-phosphate isomerase